MTEGDRIRPSAEAKKAAHEFLVKLELAAAKAEAEGQRGPLELSQIMDH